MADNAGTAMRGELRATIEGLLRTCVELERRADDAGHEARKEVDDVARVLVNVRVPGLNDLTDQILAIGGQMETNVVRALSDGRRTYLAEVHELLGLLAPYHGVNVALGPLEPTTIAVRDVDAFANQFPAGFARTYIRDLIASVDGGITLTVDNAGRLRIERVVADQAAIDVLQRNEEEPSVDHRAAAIALLKNESCHAAERHGPQIPKEHQLARLIWLLDPRGENAWRLNSDGSVSTRHWAGARTGGFTSVEALAKPLEALLSVAHESHGDLNEFLNSNLAEEQTRVGIHVSADAAGLVAGDASGYRGTATSTEEMERDWIAARKLAMKNGNTHVYGTNFDPISEGIDPGATVVFKRVGPAWQLVTCFPVDQPHPANIRLEDLE